MYSLALRTLARNFSRGRFDSNGIGGTSRGHCYRVMFAGLFEQRDQPFDFTYGVLVGRFRAGGILQHGVDQHGERLRHAVEDEQLVGDEEIHHRRLQLVLRRARHDRLDIVNEFVADETDGAAGETGQAGRRDTARYFFITRSTTSRPSLTSGRLAGGVAARRQTRQLSTTLPFSMISTRSAGLPDDRARIAADKGVAADVFAAFDGFEQERFARAADFAVGRKRGFNVRQQAAGDRDKVALARPASESHPEWANTFHFP